MENMIKSAFGINCKIEKTKVKGLPLYMTTGREFFTVNMEEISFLMMKVSDDERFGVIALEKQLRKIELLMGCEAVVYFERLTKLQRNALIERHISFIAGMNQMYLPFLGVVFHNKLKAASELPIDKMMPATQSLFLYLFYNNKEYVLKKQAASALGLTRTSITRASEQLKTMGLITEKICGKEVRMSTVNRGYELYQAAKTYLISPIQKVIYVNKKDVNDNLFIAGESALSSKSMLGDPKYEIYAMFKGDKLVKQIKEVDIKWEENNTIIQIELWKYNPAIFAKNGMVDVISMAMSLEDSDDERVRGELSKYMEEYEW